MSKMNLDNKAILKHIGNTIKKIRTMQNLSQKKLGEKCNIAESQLGKYERGQLNFTISTLNSIISALNIDFYTFTDLMRTDYYAESYKNDDELNNAAELVKQCGIQVSIENNIVKMQCNDYIIKVSREKFYNWVNQVSLLTNEYTHNLSYTIIRSEFLKLQ
jgi:transcriptional regulator with XRE-family HTH domain